MKINTDMIKLGVESRVLANPGVRRGNPGASAPVIDDRRAEPGPRWPSDGQAGERRITEALSIAQMAQHVLQRAVEISSRLRNMAMEAMASRRVDYEGIAAISAELSATLGEYAGKFGSSALPVAALNPQPGGDLEGMKALRTEISAAFREMSAYAAEMKEGGAVDASRLDALRTRMENRFTDTEKTVALLTRKGLDMAREYATGSADAALAEMGARLRESIGLDAGAALAAQGNIKREAVAALFQA